MGIPSIVTYNSLQKNDATLQKKFDDSLTIKREVDYFKSAVGKLKKVEDVFKDPRLLTFVAKSVNLESDAQYPGKLRQILSQSNTDPNAIMNRLSDKRYAQAAQTLRFGDLGLDRLKSSLTQEKMIASYQTNAYEGSVGDQNPEVRKARYFSKNAGSVNNVWDVLADPIIRDVVTATFGIPQNIAIQPIDTQAAVINSHMDITKLKDPAFRESFVKKYLNKTDLDAQMSGASTDWRVALFSGAGNAGGSSILNLFA